MIANATDNKMHFQERVWQDREGTGVTMSKEDAEKRVAGVAEAGS